MNNTLIGIGFMINGAIVWRIGGAKSLIELVFLDDSHIEVGVNA